MNLRTRILESRPAQFARLITAALPPSTARIFRPWHAFGALAVFLLLATAGVPAFAQQGYGDGYGNQNPPSQYAPAPYAYQQPVQPQYAQPQYLEPDNGQPYAQTYPQQYPQPQQPAYGQQPGYGQPYAQAYPQQYPQPGYSQQPSYAQQQYAPQQAPLTPDQLDQLLAPIALYPDSLLAQILTASTYPEQVGVANQWLEQMRAQGYGSPDQVAAGAGSQNWDPSVQGLTAFPQVLAMMDRNLEWTTQLGNAWFNQPQDVMQAVQMLRQRAQAAGTLENTPQESVTEDQGAIELAPPVPEYVYVPAYNPWAVYGAPIAPYPGFSLGGFFGDFLGAGIRFGGGIAMAAFDHTPFGLMGWTLSWLAHGILFHHATYFTRSATVTDWGFAHGGSRAYAGWSHAGHWAGGYRPGFGRALAPYNRAGGFDHSGYARPAPVGRTAEAPTRGWSRPAARPEYSRSGQEARGYGSSSYGRGLQQVYNRPTPQFSRQSSRPQPYGGYNRPAYGNRNGQSFASRPDSGYGAYGAQRSYQRAYSEPPQRSFAQEGRSGGFHSFSRGRAPKEFRGGGKAFKGFGHAKAPKMHGGSGHRHH